MSKYNYIVMCPKIIWAGLICHNYQHYHRTTASDCQTPSGQIPWDEREQETDGYGGRDVEKKRVLTLYSSVSSDGYSSHVGAIQV